MALPIIGQDLNEGKTYLDNKQYHKAVEYFSHILESAPNNVAALNGLAEGQHRSGDPMTGIRNYQKSKNPEQDC